MPKKGYNEVILLNKDNPNYDPTKAENDGNTRLVPITDCWGINDEFHQAFQKIYSKQDIEDSSEEIQEFLDSGGDTKPLEYLKSKFLTDEESNGIEGDPQWTRLCIVQENERIPHLSPKNRHH